MKLTASEMTLIAMIRSLNETMGSTSSGGSGLTIENNTKSWRVTSWVLDSFVDQSVDYGRTLEAAVISVLDDEAGVDRDKFEAEWNEHDEHLKGVAKSFE